MNRSLIYHTHIQVSGDVSICTDQGNESVSGQLDAVSKSGLTIHCSQSDIKALFPVTPTLSPKQSVQLDANFGLPEVGMISVHCDVIAIRRLSRDTFELQMNFLDSNTRSIHALSHYVERMLRSNQELEDQHSDAAEVHHLQKPIDHREDVQQVA